MNNQELDLNNIDFDEPLEESTDRDLDPNDEEDEVILCIYYGEGNLAAASYNLRSATLQVLSDIADAAPEFRVTKLLLHQLNPNKVLISGRQNEAFSKLVKKICGYCPPSTEMSTEGESLRAENSTITEFLNDYLNCRSSTRDISSWMTNSIEIILKNVELITLPGKDFELNSCQNRILNIRLPEENSREYTEQDHYVFIQGLIEMNKSSCLKACGALLKYLKCNKIGCGHFGAGDDDENDGDFGGPLIIAICKLALEEIVGIDDTTLSALQIFNATWQASASRHGSWNKRREGLSLFSLLNRCRTPLGIRYLRHMFRCPPANLETIKERQEALQFFLTPAHDQLKKFYQDCLSHIKNTPGIMKRLATGHCSVKDWKLLKKTVQNLVLICETSRKFRSGIIPLLEKLGKCDLDSLRSVANLIQRVMNVEDSEVAHKFCVNPGIDKELDTNRRLQNGMPSLLNRIAEEEIEDLPSYIQEYMILYLPQIGYVLSVKPWKEDLREDDFNINGLRFMFLAEGCPHFKSERCVQLDEEIGDIATRVAENETRIMVRLSNFILGHTENILNSTRLSAMLDCIISLACASKEFGWTRPTIVKGGRYDVIEGKHPLQEMCIDTFVPNPIKMGSDAKMMVITGPNSCGKSIYLKQVGLITFLAHLGCWVPAVNAVIPLVDQIHTRIKTLESTSLGLSAFAVDLNQMATVTTGCSQNSLVLIDEFGKGSSAIDGTSLLVSCLIHLIQVNQCFVLVSTHFQNLRAILNEFNDRILYKTFDYIFHGPQIVFLYTIVDGLCSSSQAHAVARSAGIESNVIDRSLQMLKAMTDGEVVRMNFSTTPKILKIVKTFLHKLDINDERELKNFFDDHFPA